MTRRQIALVVMAVVLVSSATALVAYRLAIRRSRQPAVSPASSGCVDIREAGSHTGEDACVSGRVLRVYSSRAGNTFLDFCSDYRDCPFTSVIFDSDRSKFGDLKTLSGREVEIRGTITVYQGRAEIIIRDPEQVRAKQ